MQTLYRKYRPQNFVQVYGQEPIVKVLRKQVEDKRVGHAYLFAGPRGTGKTSIARLLAKAVNCKGVKNGNPCNKCSTCVSITKAKFLDLIEVDAASNRGIDEIRRLRERVNFAPSEGKYKVYIIDEVHMLTKDAFNALLKTLEEPPEHIIFILATTEPHKIPMTILSRCQRFNFTLAPDKILLKRLEFICKKEKVDFTLEALMAIVRNAQGSFRDAESILEKVLGGIGVIKDKKVDFKDVKDILGLAEDNEVKEFVKKLLAKDTQSSLKIFDKVVESGVNLLQFIRQSLEYSRELLVEKISAKSQEFSLADLLKVITELSDAERKLKYTQVKRLPVEVAIVKIASSEEELNSKDSKPDKHSSKSLPKRVTSAITHIPGKIKTSFKEKREPKVKVEEMKKSWGEIVEKIRPFNHHLFAFFKKAKPLEVKGSKIILCVPFKFHKQRIESPAAQNIFSEVSKEIFGTKLSCICKVAEEKETIAISDEVIAGNSDVVVEVLGDIFE